jgi:hypothetical protein
MPKLSRRQVLIRLHRALTQRNTKFDRRQMIRLRRAGLTYAQIAEQLGCTADFVCQAISWLNLPKPPRPSTNENWRRWDTEEIDFLLSARKKGIPIRSLAVTLRRSRESIVYGIQKFVHGNR